MASVLIWFRRDLRLYDHAALYHALKSGLPVVPVFVFDRDILDELPADDRRVAFIHASLVELQDALRAAGGDLVVRHGSAATLIVQLAQEFKAQAVYTNHDYEPQAQARDAQVAAALAEQGCALHSYKDQVIFERDEVLTRTGGMYSVFTPYRRAWQEKLDDFYLRAYPVQRYLDALMPLPAQTMPSLAELGFAAASEQGLLIKAGMSGAAALWQDFLERLADYHERRDFPAVKGPSYLSVHLRFGTLSIRELVAQVWRDESAGAQTWLSELIWREFYMQILWHRPDVVTHAFKAEYDLLPYPNRQDWFDAWCAGQTGYPLVDAAMRQLNQTGYMHNRLRMVAASFLVKDLLIDWRWGERYFARQLLDYDLAANNGGWQWAASTGCDAQPYFRIFNPLRQSEQFDPQGKFIRRYCPELAELSTHDIHAPWLAAPLNRLQAGVQLGKTYPHPLVDHGEQRQAALALYKRD